MSVLQIDPSNRLRNNNSPCFNFDFVRLGSAPPYRRNSRISVDTTVLPILSHRSNIALSRIAKSTTGRSPVQLSNEKAVNIGIRASIKGGVDVIDSIETISKKKSDNIIIKQKNLHVAHDAMKTSQEMTSPKDRFGGMRVNQRSNHITEKNKYTLQTDQQVNSVNTHEKLKIAGVGFSVDTMNNQDHMLPTQSRLLAHNRHAKLKEGNKFCQRGTLNVEAVRKEADRQFYYRKRTDPSNSGNNQQISSVQLAKKTELFQRKTSKTEMSKSNNSTVTIGEYLKLENERYSADEKIVKKILFQRWLRNLQLYIGKFAPIHLELSPLEPIQSDVADDSSSSSSSSS